MRGRLADRYGLLPVAVGCGVGYALALLALLAAALAKAPAGLLIGAAAVAGLVNPPLSPGMRSLWSVHAGARLAQAAFALDAAVFDLAYITGPVLASALATGVAPAAALGLMLALLTVAGLDAPLLAVAAPLAGLCLGPTLATLFSQAAAAAPRGSGTETQAWLNSIMNGGAAGGAALAGAVLAGTGVANTGLANTGLANTGLANTGLAEAGASRPFLALALALLLALAAAGAAALGQRKTQVGLDDRGARARSVR